MGSFNEVCALSGLQIQPGDKVKCVFLTQNPYTVCDERFAQRGCYHNDQWFLRTPPLDGVYDDYGRATYDEKHYLVRLIESSFSYDIVEQPWGFNQYHAAGSPTKPKLDLLFQLAQQARLRVVDDFEHHKEKELPSEYPTWKRLRQLFIDSKLKFQEDSGSKAYNAQEVYPGVCIVSYNAYGDNTKQLQRVDKILKKHYDTKIINKYADIEKASPDEVIVVVPKGALEDHSIIHKLEEDSLNEVLNVHPERWDLRMGGRKLPVLAVMIREDVWNSYLTLKGKDRWDSYSLPTVEFIEKEISPILFQVDEPDWKDIKDEKLREKFRDMQKRMLCHTTLRTYFRHLPFQVAVGSYLEYSELTDEKEKRDLIRRCAEAAKVETVLSWCQHSWHIPPLGGQSECWKLKEDIATNIAKIAKKARLEEDARYKEDEEDD